MDTGQGWKKAAIYNPNTGTVVQFNEIVPEHCEYEQSPETDEKADTLSYSHRLERRVIGFRPESTSMIDQLETWEQDQTLVNMVIYSPAGWNTLWYENVPIHMLTKVLGASQRDGSMVYQVGLEYLGESPKIGDGVNLLDLAVRLDTGNATGWEDADNDDIADGYGFNDGTPSSYSFNNDEQFYEADTDVDFELANNLIFPISGIDLGFSIGLESMNNTNANISSYIRKSSYSSVIGSESFSLEVGDHSTNFLSFNTPPNLYYLYFRVLDPTSVSGTFSATFTKPTLRTDGKSEYVAY